MGNLNFFLFMAQPAEGANPLMTFLPLILLFVIFYFFMIRPQVRKQKELSNYRNALQKGDKIVTTGGIFGKIVDIKDNVVTIDVGGDVRIRVDKSAILKDPTDIQQK